MARPRSVPPKSVRELVQQRRDDLYARGHRNLNMALPEHVIDQLDAWKARHRLRSRDAVVARVIERCQASADPSAFVQRASTPEATLRRISPIVPSELADYLKQVQRRFRNLAYGPIFEMMIARVGADLLEPGVDDGFSARKHERCSAAGATVLTVVARASATGGAAKGREVAGAARIDRAARRAGAA